jgi:hypothetical protein
MMPAMSDRKEQRSATIGSRYAIPTPLSPGPLAELAMQASPKEELFHGGLPEHQREKHWG